MPRLEMIDNTVVLESEDAPVRRPGHALSTRDRRVDLLRGGADSAGNVVWSCGIRLSIP